MPDEEMTPDGSGPGQSPRTWARPWSLLRPHRWFACCAALALLLFGAIVTQGSGKFLAWEMLADFYDYQAASLLQGKLDVPHEAIVFEAFMHEGKSYGYFGPTPALLRMPSVLLGLGFGKVSRVWMLVHFASLLVAGYVLLLEAGRRPGSPPVPPRWLVTLFVANAGVANTAFFLASRAYVYHEAILCGVAFAVWSVWATLRYLREPGCRWWIGALVTGLLSLHARPPTGLFALTVIGLAGGWQAFARKGLPGSAKGLLIGLLATAGIASFNAVSYLKFGTFEGAPLRLHLQYTPERLAKIDSRQFHVSNLPFSANAYLFQPHASVSRYFPYVRNLSPDPGRFPAARIDLAEPIMGMPFAMPGLVLCACLSLAGLRRRTPEGPPLAVIWLGMLPLGLAMFCAVAVSHRYTADFVPFLIAAAAYGYTYLRHACGRAALALRMVAVAATLVAVALNIGLTLHFQGQRVWGVPDEVRVRYAGLRKAVDQWFGVSDPEGYDIRSFQIRAIDANLITYMAQTLSSKPDQRQRVVEYYRQVTQLTPEDPYAHARLGGALVAQGNLSEATRAFEQAVRFGPQLPFARHNLGTAYFDQRRLPEAIAEFQAALRIDPQYEPSRKILQALGIKLP